MLSSDIKKKGTFSLDLKSWEFIHKVTDFELEDMLDMDIVPTGNDVADNILHQLSLEHPRNPNSNKLWRGDIQDCYAMIKTIIYVHIMASAIRTPSCFGWDDDDWNELRSGRTLLDSYVEYKIFRESFICENERDMGYVYQKIMALIYPQPAEGIVAVPLCKYEFKR